MCQHHSSITPDDAHAVLDVKVALSPLFSTDLQTITDRLNQVLAEGVSIGVLADYAFDHSHEPHLVHSREQPVAGELFTSVPCSKPLVLSQKHAYALGQLQLWLEDNISMGTELFFDNDEKIDSECVHEAFLVLLGGSVL